MNRIEETTRQICELGDLTHEYAINLANMVDRRDEEIKRLFSKLEIAEKALTSALEGDGVLRQYEEVIEDYTQLYNAVEQTLKQLRE